MPEIHDVAVTRTEYPHFGQPDPKDKNRKWWETIYRSAHGLPQQKLCHSFIRDITEDEVQRRENEKYRFFLESILENLPIATTVKDKNDEGRYLIWNKKAAEMMEVPAEDIVGHYEEEFKP